MSASKIPCPFCSSDDNQTEQNEGEWVCVVVCNNCGAAGPSSCIERSTECERDAIANWEQRFANVDDRSVEDDELS